MLNLMKKKVIVLSALSAMAALVAFDNEADAASASAKATITAGIRRPTPSLTIPRTSFT